MLIFIEEPTKRNLNFANAKWRRKKKHYISEVEWSFRISSNYFLFCQNADKRHETPADPNERTYYAIPSASTFLQLSTMTLKRPRRLRNTDVLQVQSAFFMLYILQDI